MNFHRNELVLIYNPKTDIGKKIFATARSISNHINDIDVINTQITTTIWKEILAKLKLQPKEIMNKSGEYYDQHIRGHEITMQGMLDVLTHNPEIISGPIAIKGERAILCKTPNDILKI
jgi:arsenate reductase